MQISLLRNRYFRSLTLLILAFLLILALISGIAYTLFMDIVMFQSSQMGLRATDMLEQNAERMHSEIKALLDQMMLSTQLGKILYYEECTPGELLVALKQLNAYRSNSSFIDSIYVYSAVNDNFYISSDTAEISVQSRKEMFDTGALEILGNIDMYENYMPITRTQEFTYPIWQRAELITYVRYNALSLETPPYVLFINLRQEVYFRYFDAWPDAGDDVLIYLDQTGGVLFASQPQEEWVQVLAAEIPADTDRGSIRTDDGRLLCYNHALPGGWVLVYLTQMNPSNVIENTGGVLWRILMLGASGLLLIGLLFMLSVRFITLLRQRAAEIQQVQQERSHMLIRHRQRILLEALAGSAGSEMADILPENSAAAIGLIIPETCSRQMTLSLEKLLTELLGSYMLFAVTDEHCRITVCLSAAAEQEDAASLLEHCVKKAGEVLDESLHVVLSDEFEGIAGLADAYAWCVDTSLYTAIIPPYMPFTRESLYQRETLGYLYPEEEQQRLIACLYKMELLCAEEALREAFDILTSLSLRVYRIGLMKLTLAIHETLDILAKKYNILDHEEAPSLHVEKSAAEQQAILADSMRTMLSDIQDKRDAKYEPLMAQISRHITAHISDAELSQDTIAEAVGLSASHLSRITRKQRGVSLAEWIFNERITRAKELLTDSDRPVAEIAGLCGFYDPQYFYKAFKRTCGVTPGVYRQVHKQEDTGQTT